MCRAKNRSLVLPGEMISCIVAQSCEIAWPRHTWAFVLFSLTWDVLRIYERKLERNPGSRQWIPLSLLGKTVFFYLVDRTEPLNNQVFSLESLQQIKPLLLLSFIICREGLIPIHGLNKTWKGEGKVECPLRLSFIIRIWSW